MFFVQVESSSEEEEEEDEKDEEDEKEEEDEDEKEEKERCPFIIYAVPFFLSMNCASQHLPCHCSSMFLHKKNRECH